MTSAATQRDFIVTADVARQVLAFVTDNGKYSVEDPPYDLDSAPWVKSLLIRIKAGDFEPEELVEVCCLFGVPLPESKQRFLFGYFSSPQEAKTIPGLIRSFMLWSTYRLRQHYPPSEYPQSAEWEDDACSLGIEVFSMWHEAATQHATPPDDRDLHDEIKGLIQDWASSCGLDDVVKAYGEVPVSKKRTPKKTPKAQTQAQPVKPPAPKVSVEKVVKTAQQVATHAEDIADIGSKGLKIYSQIRRWRDMLTGT